jgi:hypothetical protein
VVAILDVGIFTPMVQWFYELDYQYRSKPMMVKQYGPLGQYAMMEEVPLLQSGKNLQYKWYGTESNKSIQQIQQQIAAMNVFKGIPPEQLNGRKFDAGPILDQIALTVFGPRLAPHILIDQRHQLTLPPEQENMMMLEHFFIEVHPMDDDVQHIQAHQEAMQEHGDEGGFFRTHIIEHLKQMQAKNAQAHPKGLPGAPGAAGQPGQQGAPRQGAIAGPPKPMQNPPGAIHQDSMQDASRMPR